MNQLCKVCGEPAAGFHFGAFTCEGCKSFFGRTYNNLSSISECKNNGECVINKKNRTACKACRLRKCLLVGMSKSGSRYGRRSNWFKIHCLLQEQQQSHQQAGGNATSAAAAAAAATVNLLRPYPHLPFFRHHQLASMSAAAMASTRDARSSESDSGASSADPEDDLRSTSALSFLKLPASPSSERDYFSGGSSKKLPSPASDGECFQRRKIASALAHFPPAASPASLPAISPGGGATTLLPRWLPPLQGVADPASWRELWLKGSLSIPAAAAPDQDQPIDLSVRQTAQARPPPPAGAPTSPGAAGAGASDSEAELNIDVGVDEPIKSVPLDLTLERQAPDVVTN